MLIMTKKPEGRPATEEFIPKQTTLFPEYFKVELDKKVDSAMQFLKQEEPNSEQPPYCVGF